MNKFKSLIVLTLVVALIGISGEVGAAGSRKVLRMLGFLPLHHQLTKTAEILKDEIEKNSNGEIEIKFYPAQQLYNHKSSIPVLQEGGVEMALIQTGFWTGVVPSISVTSFLTYYNNFDHYQAVMEGYPGKVFAEDFEKRAHLKVIGWANYGKLEFASKKPIKVLEDFQGMRLRATGADAATWIQAMSAAPVTMNSGEVYQALQRGTIDGGISGPSSFDQRKWYEVAKYMTDSSLSPVYAYFMVVHIDTWNSLSQELQQVFLDAAQKAHDFNIAAAEKEDTQAKEKLIKMGMVNNVISTQELAKWRAMGVPPLIEKYKESIGAEKAGKILDAIEALRKKYE